MPTLTDSQRNGRATRKLMRDNASAGHAGLSFQVDTKRRVAHVAIHDKDAIGCGCTFTEEEFAQLAEKLLQNVRAPEALPTIARLLRHESWEQRHALDRANGELQTLRWRIMHLEREANERRPAYSDATALVLVGTPRQTVARATEREMEFRDDRGAVRFGLVDEEKGWCTPLAAGKGGAS